MSIVETKISGLDEIQRRLEDLPRRQAGGILRKALRAGAAPVLSAMQNEAPHASGFLAEHFNTKISIKRNDIAGAAFVGPAGKMDYPFAAGHRGGRYTEKTNAKGKQYLAGRIPVATVARFHEFGTRFEAANPFMSRAFDGTKQTALMGIINALRELVNLK